MSLLEDVLRWPSFSEVGPKSEDFTTSVEDALGVKDLEFGLEFRLPLEASSHGGVSKYHKPAPEVDDEDVAAESPTGARRRK